MLTTSLLPVHRMLLQSCPSPVRGRMECSKLGGHGPLRSSSTTVLDGSCISFTARPVFTSLTKSTNQDRCEPMSSNALGLGGWIVSLVPVSSTGHVVSYS